MSCTFAHRRPINSVGETYRLWVSHFPSTGGQSAAELKEIDGVADYIRAKGRGEYLISIMRHSRKGVTHEGSMLLKTAAGAASAVVVTPIAFAPHTDDRNYAELDLKSDSEMEFLSIHFSGLGVVDNNLASKSGFNEAYAKIPYDSALQTLVEGTDEDRFAFLMGFSRDCMILAPTLRVPGWFGIPPCCTVNIGDTVKEALELGDTSTLQRYAGKYATDGRAVWFDEPIDDLAPWQFTQFRGDDCDGAAMAAYAFFLSLNTENFSRHYEPMLVSGLSTTPCDSDCGHQWLMLWGKDGPTIFCETTAETTETAHFDLAIFAWSPHHCYAFFTVAEYMNAGPKIRLGAAAGLIHNRPLPKHDARTLSLLNRPDDVGKVGLVRLAYPTGTTGAERAALFRYCHRFEDEYTDETQKSKYYCDLPPRKLHDHPSGSTAMASHLR